MAEHLSSMHTVLGSNPITDKKGQKKSNARQNITKKNMLRFSPGGKRQKVAQLCEGIMETNDFNLKFQQSTKGGGTGEFSKQSFLISETKSVTKLNKASAHGTSG